MKTLLSWALVCLAFGASSCIYVRVKGDLQEEFFEEDSDFSELFRGLESSFGPTAHDLSLNATLFRIKTEWTVKFAGSDAEAEEAFRRAKGAVLERIADEGGELLAQHDEGPGEWTCDFRLDGDESYGGVRLATDDSDPELPRRLYVRWQAPH